MNIIEETADTADIVSYFDNYDIAKENDMTIEKAVVCLVNLESEEIMGDIANGDYSTFDLFDRDQFNDEYYGMLEDLF